MLTGDFKIRRLTRAIKDDFNKVHRSGEYGDGCLCGFWWMESIEGWDQRTDEESRAQREDLFDRGIEDGYLFYEKGEPIGWCQAYQRDLLIHLVNEFHFSPDPDIWCVSCFMMNPSVRGRGLSHTFLAAMLEDLKERGVKKVQAYPRSGVNLSVNDIWSGPEALYAKAGFVKVTDLPGRSVWEKALILE
jgi:GNAT superfamily N-acetyltransferase